MCVCVCLCCVVCCGCALVRASLDTLGTCFTLIHIALAYREAFWAFGQAPVYGNTPNAQGIFWTNCIGKTGRRKVGLHWFEFLPLLLHHHLLLALRRRRRRRRRLRLLASLIALIQTAD